MKRHVLRDYRGARPAQAPDQAPDQDQAPTWEDTRSTLRAFRVGIWEALFWLAFGLVAGFAFGCTWGAMQ